MRYVHLYITHHIFATTMLVSTELKPNCSERSYIYKDIYINSQSIKLYEGYFASILQELAVRQVRPEACLP